MNLEKLVTIYNIMRQMTVSGENVKLMYTCLTTFEDFFRDIQHAQQMSNEEKIE